MDYESGPIFTKSEQRLIDAYAGQPQAPNREPKKALSGKEREEFLSDVSEEDHEYRIREQKADMERVVSKIRRFTDDLQRVRNYYHAVNSSPHEFQKLCQAWKRDLEQEFRRLREELEHWEKLAESQTRGVPNDLQQAFEPLFEYLDEVEQSERTQVWDDLLGDLVWVLSEEENAFEILESIAENSYTAQINSFSESYITKDGEEIEKSWTEYAGQVLQGKKGLVMPHAHSSTKNKGFALTAKGETILNVLRRLVELNRVHIYAEQEGCSKLTAAEYIMRQEINFNQ